MTISTIPIPSALDGSTSKKLKRNDSSQVCPNNLTEKTNMRIKKEGGKDQRPASNTNAVSSDKFSALTPPSQSTNFPNESNTPSEHIVDLIVTADPSRNKCIEMFYQALKLGVEERKAEDPELHEPFELDNAADISIGIEKSLFEIHGNPSNDSYKKTFRSKYLNLKDKSNPALRKLLLNGEKSPKEFINMTTLEMASEERRMEDDRINRENLLKARASTDNAPETDMFQCGRCKQRKCKYFQMQTRSADEPMTAYITCMHCKNRWKM